MEQFSMRRLLRSLSFCIVTIGLTGCVDRDYDLSEDLDLTFQLGGDNLTLPGSSSTDLLYLSQILDLEEGSSIKPVEKNGEYGLSIGDYVLKQQGNSNSSEFDISLITIGHINGNRSTIVLPEFYNIDGSASISRDVNTVVDGAVHLEDNDITDELVSLESADINVDLTISVGYLSTDFSGTAYIEPGYTISFDPCWTIEVADATTAQYIENVNDHTVRFKTRQAITRNNNEKIKLRITKADLSGVPDGQGLYAPGKFLLDNDVTSEGLISLDISDLALGERANLIIETDIEVGSAVIEKVRGIVDPKIDVEDTSFEIEDVPDFLSDPKNKLDINNPQINISVSNSSPLSISLSAELSSFVDESENATVGVGEQFGTDPIIVRGNSSTNYVISSRPVAGADNNVIVPNLGKLLETIPDRISIHDITSKALREVAEYTLGTTYNFYSDYEAVVPLAFGDALELYYSHVDDDWGSDSDLEDYNFDTAEVTLDVTNTIPLNLTPSATALNIDGNDMNNVTATVEGAIEAGSIAAPSTSSVKIILKSTGKNMAGIDGIRLMLDAKSNSAYKGINLNENQALKFDNIRITIKGGVIVDLND